jgi:hypothetical protein
MGIETSDGEKANEPITITMKDRVVFALIGLVMSFFAVDCARKALWPPAPAPISIASRSAASAQPEGKYVTITGQIARDSLSSLGPIAKTEACGLQLEELPGLLVLTTEERHPGLASIARAGAGKEGIDPKLAKVLSSPQTFTGLLVHPENGEVKYGGLALKPEVSASAFVLLDGEASSGLTERILRGLGALVLALAALAIFWSAFEKDEKPADEEGSKSAATP